MKIFILLLMLPILSFARCDVSFEKTDLCASLNWIEGPHLNKQSHLQVSFWNKDHNENDSAVSPAYDVEVYSYMMMDSGNNHKGPYFNILELNEGVFEAFDVRLIDGMKGYWQIRIELRKDGKLVSESSSNVEIKK